MPKLQDKLQNTYECDQLHNLMQNNGIRTDVINEIMFQSHGKLQFNARMVIALSEIDDKYHLILYPENSEKLFKTEDDCYQPSVVHCKNIKELSNTINPFAQDSWNLFQTILDNLEFFKKIHGKKIINCKKISQLIAEHDIPVKNFTLILRNEEIYNKFAANNISLEEITKIPLRYLKITLQKPEKFINIYNENKHLITKLFSEYTSNLEEFNSSYDTKILNLILDNNESFKEIITNISEKYQEYLILNPQDLDYDRKLDLIFKHKNNYIKIYKEHSENLNKVNPQVCCHGTLKCILNKPDNYLKLIENGFDHNLQGFLLYLDNTENFLSLSKKLQDLNVDLDNFHKLNYLYKETALKCPKSFVLILEKGTSIDELVKLQETERKLHIFDTKKIMSACAALIKKDAPIDSVLKLQNHRINILCNMVAYYNQHKSSKPEDSIKTLFELPDNVLKNILRQHVAKFICENNVDIEALAHLENVLTPIGNLPETNEWQGILLNPHQFSTEEHHPASAPHDDAVHAAGEPSEQSDSMDVG